MIEKNPFPQTSRGGFTSSPGFLPTKTYSQEFLCFPLCGRQFGLCQTKSPSCLNPASTASSQSTGSPRQSIKQKNIPPGFITRKHSPIHSSSHFPKNTGEIPAPARTGKRRRRELEYIFADSRRSPASESASEAYGGSVTTASTEASGIAAKTLRLLPRRICERVKSMSKLFGVVMPKSLNKKGDRCSDALHEMTFFFERLKLKA